MKYLLIVSPFLFILSLISCMEMKESSKGGESIPNLSLKAEFLKRGMYILPGSGADSTIVYHFIFDLENQSRDTVYFISMTCSHEDMFIVEDTTMLDVHPTFMCYSNYPFRVMLPPDSTYSRRLMVRPLEKELKASVNTRIGFKYVGYDEENYLFGGIINMYEKRDSLCTVIWSNPVMIEQ